MALPPVPLLRQDKKLLFSLIKEKPYEFIRNREYRNLLYERDNLGETGWHILAQMGIRELLYFREVWRIKDDFGQPVAFYMVRNGCWSLSPEFLSIRGIGGRTIAHELASKFPFLIYEQAPYSFSWADNRGWTVAHELAKNGVKFSISDPIVKLRTKEGISVFSVMVYNMTAKELSSVPDEFWKEKVGNSYLIHYLAEKLVIPKNKELLLIKDREGKSALYRYLFMLYRRNKISEENIRELLPVIKKDLLSLTFLAERKFFSERKDKELLKTVVDEPTGTTLAHVEASAGKNFKTEEILKLSDKYGWTVAHIQASRGEARYSIYIKTLNNEGDYPVHIYVKKGFPVFEDEIFCLKNIKEIPAWAYSKNPPLSLIERHGKEELKKLLSFPLPSKEKIKDFLIKEDKVFSFAI